MILYDSNFKIIGMSESVLRLFGYSGFGSFFSRHSDISELFVSQNGFIIQTDEHFIEKILQTKKPITTIVKTTDEKTIEVTLYADLFFQKEIYENSYIVTLEAKDCQDSQTAKKSSNVYKKRESRLNTLPNIFEKEYKKNLENLETQKTQSALTGTQLNKDWLIYSSNKLELDSDIFIDLLRNLVEQANEQEEILYESLLVGDTSHSSLILANLRDSASVLNIRPLTRTLYNLENSNSNNVSENFREYKDIIMQINKITTKRD